MLLVSADSENRLFRVHQTADAAVGERLTMKIWERERGKRETGNEKLSSD